MATLREELDRRKVSGDRFRIREIVAMLVAPIVEAEEAHDRGDKLFITPGVMSYKPGGGSQINFIAAGELPKNASDRACLAPEQRSGRAGDSRASVFAFGAILYELITNETVGPGMKRPSEVVATLPQSLEDLIGKALVADPSSRPGDLGALAQALHQCAPTASLPPPDADDFDLDVDVSMSMLPPPPAATAPTSSPISTAAVSAASAAVASQGTTAQLSYMKDALEADPRPRYVVVAEGMDHGPFSAVELLQQIASGSFMADHELRDTISNDSRLISEWDEFAPFAKHAGLKRANDKERKAMVVSANRDQESTQNKALIGVAVLALFSAVVGGWWLRKRARQEAQLAVQTDEAQSIDVDSGLGKKKGGGGRWMGGGKTSGGSSGPRPVLPGGMSCEGAQSRYVEEYKMTGEGAKPDLTAGAYAKVLNRGTYLNSCGVPPNVSVSICAAVQNGRAVGVTVNTKPRNAAVARCVSGAIRGMGFPSHPRLDVARTHFKAQ